MDNPWQSLPQSSPYLVAADRTAVLFHNKRVAEKFQIRYDVLPEPYLGEPNAPIILLSLNPGFKESDLAFYAKHKVRELWQANILHEPTLYPFYLLHPSLANELGGNRWWQKKLKPLIEISSVRDVANKLCCIEFFPYHSLRYKSLNQMLPSQLYNFHLVRHAIDNGSIIVLMRGEKLWIDAVPELIDYSRLFRLNSVQNVTLSERNCPMGFPMIQTILNG
jgi:hypothetical protein